jgi:hypothetical protein
MRCAERGILALAVVAAAMVQIGDVATSDEQSPRRQAAVGVTARQEVRSPRAGTRFVPRRTFSTAEMIALAKSAKAKYPGLNDVGAKLWLSNSLILDADHPKGEVQGVWARLGASEVGLWRPSDQKVPPVPAYIRLDKGAQLTVSVGGAAGKQLAFIFTIHVGYEGAKVGFPDPNGYFNYDNSSTLASGPWDFTVFTTIPDSDSWGRAYVSFRVFDGYVGLSSCEVKFSDPPKPVIQVK